MFLFRNRYSFDYYFLHIIVPELVYTMLITIFLYFIILKINQRLEAIEKGVQVSLFDNIKEALRLFFKSRLTVAAILMIAIFSILLWRMFALQIVNGASISG